MAIYMPVSPQVVAAMLACARIGAVHNVIFAGFSAESLAGRINDGKHVGRGRELERSPEPPDPCSLDLDTDINKSHTDN